MPLPAYNNLCGLQLRVRWSPTPFVFSLVRQFLFLSRGSPICNALFFKLIFKNNKFLYLYSVSQSPILLPLFPWRHLPSKLVIKYAGFLTSLQIGHKRGRCWERCSKTKMAGCWWNWLSFAFYFQENSWVKDRFIYNCAGRIFWRCPNVCAV
jgi:hypothetical protein